MTLRKPQRSALGPIAVAALGLGMAASAEDAAAAAPTEHAVRPPWAEVAEPDLAEQRRRQTAVRQLIEHPSPAIRRQAVDQFLAQVIDLRGDTEELLIRLATDPEPVVRRTLAVSLGLILARLNLLDGYYLLASWATAPQPELRWAAACALCRPLAIPGVRAALACFSGDSDPLVRRIAEQAARRHGLAFSESSICERPAAGEAEPTEPGRSAQSPPHRPRDPEQPCR